mgnify:FL=1
MKFNHGKWIKKFKSGNINEAPVDFDSDRMEPGSEFDVNYYVDQLDGMLEGLRELEQELITDIDYRAESSGDLIYGQMPNQIQRYLNAAERQIGGLSNYLKRQGKKI